MKASHTVVDIFCYVNLQYEGAVHKKVCWKNIQACLSLLSYSQNNTQCFIFCGCCLFFVRCISLGLSKQLCSKSSHQHCSSRLYMSQLQGTVGVTYNAYVVKAFFGNFFVTIIKKLVIYMNLSLFKYFVFILFCQSAIFPPENQISPVADQLRKVLATAKWARVGLGLPVVSRKNPYPYPNLEPHFLGSNNK